MTTVRRSRQRRSNTERRTVDAPPPLQDPEGTPATVGGDARLVARLQARLQAVRAIGQVMARHVGTDALFAELGPHISVLMHAERSILFLYDAIQQDIWSKIQSDGDAMRLPLGKGIAGWVAASRQPLNIADAYSDVRFSPELDRHTGLRTGSVLAVPLINSQSVLLGVIQVINHASGSFTEDDLGLLQAIATEAAYAVENTYLTEQLLSQNRWAAMGHMMASLAHDLRNPMTSLAFHMEMMAREDDRAARRTRHAQLVRHLDEMSAMLSDVLAFSRGDSRLHPVDIGMAALAAEVEGDLRVLCAPHDVELRMRVDPGSATIDVARTRRILYNLVKNAVEALPRGGWVELHLQANADGLRLEVADNGPGIAPALVHRIFEPFTASNGSKPHSNGLGLSIVKRFVEDQGGHITLRSDLGRGTTFFIHVPNIS